MGNLLIVVVPALCHERESPFGEPGICKLNGTTYVSLSMAIGSIFTWTYTYNLIRSASLINEMKELENGLHENIPNINYLNAGETSKLLQRIVIIPAVPSSGGDYPSDKPKANGMVWLAVRLKHASTAIHLNPGLLMPLRIRTGTTLKSCSLHL